TAVRFAHDDATQNYIELEGGGKRAFAALLEANAYAPYWWDVRLFTPGEITESIVRFKPDGTPYGFRLKLPETWAPADPQGLALPASPRARCTASAAASSRCSGSCGSTGCCGGPLWWRDWWSARCSARRRSPRRPTHGSSTTRPIRSFRSG